MEWYRWMFLGIAIVMGIVTAVTVYTLFKQAEADKRAHISGGIDVSGDGDGGNGNGD